MQDKPLPSGVAPGIDEHGPGAAPEQARVVLDPAGIDRAIRRIAHEILERNTEPARLVLVAIREGGVSIGERLARVLAEVSEREIPLGILDVTLYRDDVIGHGERPVPRSSRIPFSVAGQTVILVEDVVFTGRTVRAAMDAVIDFGRPAAIQVATLVDRGHREFPIRVDFVGKNMPTHRSEEVLLRAGEGETLEVVVR
jgi:pyrimidine operon attenuation protein/uracil phosphoribosyltransferase